MSLRVSQIVFDISFRVVNVKCNFHCGVGNEAQFMRESGHILPRPSFGPQITRAALFLLHVVVFAALWGQ